MFNRVRELPCPETAVNSDWFDRDSEFMKSIFFIKDKIKIEFRLKSMLIKSDLNLEPLEIGVFKFILIRWFFIIGFLA